MVKLPLTFTKTPGCLEIFSDSFFCPPCVGGNSSGVQTRVFSWKMNMFLASWSVESSSFLYPSCWQAESEKSALRIVVSALSSDVRNRYWWGFYSLIFSPSVLRPGWGESTLYPIHHEASTLHSKDEGLSVGVQEHFVTQVCLLLITTPYPLRICLWHTPTPSSQRI